MKRKDGKRQIVRIELFGTEVTALCGTPEGFNYTDRFQGLVGKRTTAYRQLGDILFLQKALIVSESKGNV